MESGRQRQVVFLSQRREEPHNTEVQVRQTTAEMKWEMDVWGSFQWVHAPCFGQDFRVRLIDKDPLSFLRDRPNSVHLIETAMTVAKEKGATDIGLGSLVASVTRGGKDLLVKADSLGLRLDHGDDMSTALAVESARRLREAGLKFEGMTVGVVGAVGIMGAGFVRILMDEVDSWVLVVREVDERVYQLEQEIKTRAAERGKVVKVVIGTEFGELARQSCGLVYVAHAAPHARLLPSHISTGTIVLDACVPPAVDLAEFASRENLILSVGCGILPKAFKLGVDLGMGSTRKGQVAYGCMIGCMMAAYLGVTEHKIQPVDPHYAERLLKEAKLLGVEPQPFRYPMSEVKEFIRLHAGRQSEVRTA